MKHLINFETDLFNSTESKPHFINDRCFGEDLIAWLIANFSDHTFVLDEPFQEDWGWATLARRGKETFLIGAGIMDESIGTAPAEWIIIVEKMRRFMIFGSKKFANLAVLSDSIEKTLQGEDRINDIRRSIEQ